MSSSLIVTHDMTELIQSLPRMSPNKAPDLLKRINTNKLIAQNTDFNLAHQCEIRILSMMTGIEIFLAIINIFVFIFISKAFITSSQVSYYFHIQLNPSIYIPDSIAHIAKEIILCATEALKELAIPIQVELIPIQTQATDINTIYKIQANRCNILLNSKSNYSATILVLITSNIISCTGLD